MSTPTDRPPLCLVRGGGDVGTGVVWRLWRSGFPVVVAELAQPLTVRRTVAVSSAVHDGEIQIESMTALGVDDPTTALELARQAGPTPGQMPGQSWPVVPVVVNEQPFAAESPLVGRVDVVVDARLAKRNIDTTQADAPLVVALGPGFRAGHDCDVVVETMRGHGLGRTLWSGSALANTGIPAPVAGRAEERVLRAPTHGQVEWDVAIGDQVSANQTLGRVGESTMVAPFTGVIRGLICPGLTVRPGLKIGDIDPRLDTDCFRISDKALAVGGGVLEAVVAWWLTPDRA